MSNAVGPWAVAETAQGRAAIARASHTPRVAHSTHTRAPAGAARHAINLLDDAVQAPCCAIAEQDGKDHRVDIAQVALCPRLHHGWKVGKSQAVAEKGAGDTEGINGHLGIHVQQAQRVGAVLW